MTADYRARAVRLSDGKAWLLKLAKSHRAQARALVSELNKIIQSMPSEEYLKLQRKITGRVPAHASQWLESYDSELRDIVVEILGWQWLHRRYPGDRVQFNETPDLVVVDSNDAVVAAMECKKVNLSEKERAWISSGQIKGGILPENLTEGWLNKVHHDICCARCQLGRANKAHDKFIFISFSFDTPDWVSEAPARQQEEAHLREWVAILRKGGVCLIAFEGFDVEKRIV